MPDNPHGHGSQRHRARAVTFDPTRANALALACTVVQDGSKTTFDPERPSRSSAARLLSVRVLLP